jgi:hypothetical protein
MILAGLEGQMPIKAGIVLLALVAIITSGSAHGTDRIYDDLGGQIGTYVAKYRALRASGEQIVIDGTCASACTMILGEIPRNRLCVTPRAVLDFHAAWNSSPSGERVISRAGNAVLWSTYPGDIRRWIERHGGLGSQIIYLRGTELEAMVRLCR